MIDYKIINTSQAEELQKMEKQDEYKKLKFKGYLNYIKNILNK